MRRNITFVITLLVMAIAAITVTNLANAQGIFLPSLYSTNSNAVGAEADEQLPPPPPEPRAPVEITDLVPELPDDQKTQVVFQDADGNQTSFYVAYRDHNTVNELIAQHGTLMAIFEPRDRGYPENPIVPGEPEPTSDPNFVHPDPEMPPAPPIHELLEQQN